MELSGFFCEERSSFRLEEAFKLFHIFALRFAQAVRENKERRQREEKERLRKIGTHKSLALETETRLTDKYLYTLVEDIRCEAIGRAG